MEKSRKNRIARLFLIIVGVPLLLIWTLIALLYVPAIQQYAVDTICRKIAQSSGYAEGILCASGNDASFTNETFEKIDYTPGEWA